MKAPALVVHSQAGRPISSIEEWFAYAPPAKGIDHWVSGRSARESAEAWFRTGLASVPQEIEAILRTHTLLDGIQVHSAVPEMHIPLDGYRGNTRNADVVAYATLARGTCVISIEAKADEPFGELVGKYYDRERSPNSNVRPRIAGLCRAVFGTGLCDRIRGLRYQLLHGIAASLIEARNSGASTAVFLVHEFVTNKTRQEARAENSRALADFVATLDPTVVFSATGLNGPFRVQGGGLVPQDVPLLIGKVEYRITEDRTA